VSGAAGAAAGAADGTQLIVEHAGPVLRITLDNPRRKNALTVGMIDAIADAVEAAGRDDTTRVIVLGATGDDFCTGIDLAQANSGSGAGERGERGERVKPRTGHLQRSFTYGAHRMIHALDAVQVPVVAGVRGWAAGIGNMLALSADVVIATPSAKFWVPFVTKGFTPDSGNTYLLPRLVGVARAKEMILRGKPVDGERAARWGLVSDCVADNELGAAVEAVVEEFADAATVSVGLAKTLLHRNLDCDLATALQNEGIYEELAVRSDDFKEGIRSFVEKRGPRYTGW
jgi:2-(1,2-epoxy-1,2-dihydrophenyl)acetyl-CoA isomerase